MPAIDNERITELTLKFYGTFIGHKKRGSPVHSIQAEEQMKCNKKGEKYN